MKTLRSAADLVKAGLVPADRAGDAARVAARYAVAVTDQVAALALASPAVARQYLPDIAELEAAPGERSDPIGDSTHMPVKGVVHRYPDRVLLKPLHACPVYCRFCFRREMVGPGGDALDDAELEAALAYIRGQPGIWEVIVTGGDPFMLSPRRLGELVVALDAIPHVAVIRIHTRVPLAAPHLVVDPLVAALAVRYSALYVAVHCNHADELDEAPRAALRRLADAGIPLLSQSVLLRGVNDSLAALEDLFRALVRLRVKPYYLHQMDLAPGTAHFRVPLDEGRRLVAALRGRLSGLAVPTFVLDVPGGFGKVPVNADHLVRTAAGWRVTDPTGAPHDYPEAAPGPR
jgi:lysine 2,3-aminomutase